MVSKQQARSSLLVVIAAVLLAAAAGGCGESASPASPAPVTATGEQAASSGTFGASGQAKDELGNEGLGAYLDAGVDLELDWTILAAADQIESPGASGDPSDRANAIGYTLIAAGAPGDYEVALEARGGAAFAERVLALADRYRGRSSSQDEALPVSATPLEAPTDGRLVASFGRGYGLLHDGMDIEAEAGAPIRAVASGIVASAGFSPAYGNYTCVLHRLEPQFQGVTKITTCYGNQSSYETEPGALVERGETIGRIGCSGPCLRPHVHFQVLLGSGPDGEAVDPAPFLGSEFDGSGMGPGLEGT